MRNLFCLFIFVAFINSKVLSQDPHFSQFFASPLTLNPAFTGKFDGKLRVAGNYRNQWPTINRAFVTTTLSVDMPIMKSSIAPNDTWGVGVMAYSDQSANSTLKINYLTLSTAFHKGLDEDGYHQIGAAFQGSFSNMTVDVTKVNFEDQLTSAGFTGVTSEPFTNTTLKSSYLDLNAGVLYTGSSSDKNNFYAGISIYHLNRPKQYFTNNFFLLNPRTTFHAGGFFPVGQSTRLHLSGLFSTQAKASETVIGGAMEFVVADATVEKPVSLYVGSWLRMNDAVIPYVGLEFSDFRLGLTYDATISSLKSASQGRGGMELSLIYIKKSPDSRGLPCPKF
ncbi:MAG: PorP/SprF family type IX secretion system membrane protein [Chitinophagaceae bacterium]|nr:PorP/SprF family type IX secretion system membrane protein [Chitinophagaceae bacterium]